MTSEKKEIYIDAQEKIPLPAEVYVQLGQKSSKNIRILMKHFFISEELLKGSYTNLENLHSEIESTIISNFYYESPL